MKGGRLVNSPAKQDYYASFIDLLVGILFIFIVLFVFYALTYKEAEEGLRRKIQGLEEQVQIRTNLLQRLERSLNRQGVPATAEIDQGVLRLRESVLFERGRADLGPEAQRALRILAAELMAELPCYGARFRSYECRNGAAPILEAVYIEGHTDNIRINTSRYPSNWELSSARAIVTYNFLRNASEELLGLRNASDRATLIGASAYADTRPVPNARTPDENRRIDFRFLLAPPSITAAAQGVAQ